MATGYFSNSVYARSAQPNNEDSIYSGVQAPARSVASARTAASAFSRVTKSADFCRTDTGSLERRLADRQGLLAFIWDPKAGTFLGRDAPSWVRLTVYTLAMHGIVALVWTASFAFFDFAVLDEDRPGLSGEHNALRMTPSLSYVPQPDHYTTLIRFRSSQMSTVRKYVDDIVAFTQWYEEHGLQSVEATSETLKECSTDQRNEKPMTTVCRYNLNYGGRCNAYKNFGFDDGDPCFAFKLNRVYGWVPQPTDNQTGVIVRCRGRSLADQDFIGAICYHYPGDGRDGSDEYCKRDFGVIPHYYFPYLRQVRYMSPLVFVEFRNVHRNVVVMVECEAEAKNLAVDRTYRIGMTQFEIMVD